jgi:Tfp pilus assembly protein PilX
MSRSRVLALPSDLPRRPRRGEAGSAYLVAILALVVLTIAGLSLALITQTETQIGANEKMVERAFYAADSGIAISTQQNVRKHPIVRNQLPNVFVGFQQQ